MRVRGKVLPCVNSELIVQQVRPTVELLINLDQSHPDILANAVIDPAHYHRSNVFRSAIETIRGQQAAIQTVPREQFVGRILEAMEDKGLLSSAQKTPPGVRWDFTAELETNPRRRVAIEVKGGEGNSLNLSNRPPDYQEFIIWSHLDGSVIHSPARGAQAVIGRVVADIIKAPKQIDALIFRDKLCGTEARPCPKYAGGSHPVLGPAPDIFLLPSAVPIFGRDLHPPVHTEATCSFPFRLLDFFGVSIENRPIHVHTVDIRLYLNGNIPMREVIVRQNGVEQFRNSAKVQVR
ncbi:MAG: hypothetical protein ACR2HJ_02895 [Fimbriimonadales bacterium]